MARILKKTIQESPERTIVLGSIVSERFLKELREIFRPDLIETKFVLTVLDWCWSYFDQFKAAPGVHIEDIFDEQVREGNVDEHDEQLIADLLQSLSDEYDRKGINDEYLLKQAEDYFERRNLQEISTSIKTHVAKGDLPGAQAELNRYRTIARPTSAGVDPFVDSQQMRAAFEYSTDPIIRLPGAVGEFFNDMLVRDSFVSLLGPEKRGKTWLLIELSIWARRSGLNVAFFSAGDMTLPQMMIRYGIRFAGRSNKPRYCGELLIPTLDCAHNQNDRCDLEDRVETPYPGILDAEGNLFAFADAEDHVPCRVCRNARGSKYKGAVWYKQRPAVEPLTWNEAAKAGENMHKRWGKKSRMKLIDFPNETLSVPGIERQLDSWEAQESFVPDVILIDYMDLLIPGSTTMGDQARHRIDSVWKGARRLSQERHCLVLSATQSDTLSYSSKWITSKNFSESKTKNAHVTGMITMNQTNEEKKAGIMRLGRLNTREDEFFDNKGVTILQSLAIGRPILHSFF